MAGRKEYDLRLGILGGTFDPIHLGHLCMAEEVAEELHLAKVCLIPTALPPHKEKSISSFQDRLAMTRLAAQESGLLEALDLEGRRPGFSYSIETLKELPKLFDTPLELFFILGLDAFLEIKTWKDYRRIMDYCNLAVVERPGSQIDSWAVFVASLQMDLKPSGQANHFKAQSGNELIILNRITHLDISSTLIREKIGQGRSVRFLVPASVNQYLKEKGLYRKHGST
jgi:nicotinate-nucleotide adenylyltransferase